MSLLLQDRRQVRYKLRDLESYEASDSSRMPDGLVQQMTVSDLRNLLAFLTR